ncbi:hypothetical protein HYW74_01365 [Candidatus Pacearchaeota archaeon]|nr:hypothetical protein [Candidatus Pacearchaeota archaeon]
MTNRKKRLKKGIESLQKQIKIHEEKREKAKEEDMEDLVRYYTKEIEAKKKDKEKKEKALEK